MGESENKIEELERRISYLEQEVALLKNPSKSITSNRSFSLDGYEKYMTPEKPEATSDVHVELQPQIQPLTQPQEEPVNNQAKYIRPESRKKDMEAFIGKHGMAVGASLLIFIAMVMFATLLIPKLSVELKCAALFIFSGAFIVAGLIHEKKNGINKWNTAIIGCGTGAVFISIYVLYSYILEVRFPSGGIIVLFVLLIAWASALCFLSNKKSMIYAVIAQIGILISAIFGNIQLSGDLSVVLPIVMILISEAPFMITDLFRKNYWNYIVTWMGASLSTFVVTVDDGILMDYIGWGCLFYIVAAALIIYTYFAGAAFAKTKKEVTAAIITGCLTVCPFIMFLCMDIKDSLDAEWSCLISLILVAVAGAMGLFIDRLCIKNDYHGPIKSAVHSILLVVIFGYLGMAIDARIDAYTVIISLMLPFIAIAASIYADRASNVVYKYYALVMLALSVLIDNDYTVLKSIIAFGMIIYIAYSMVKARYISIIFNDIAYILCILILTYVIQNFLDYMDAYKTTVDVVECIALTIAQIFVYRYRIVVERYSNGAQSRILFGVVNLLWAVLLSTIMENYINSPIAILIGALLVIVASINVSEVYRKYSWGGAYVSLKYSAVFFAFAYNYSLSGALFSVGFLVIAIIAIIIGFVVDVKSMRLYGLVLSIISIVKLILIDIDYSSLAVRAFSFLMCGLICFAISYLYNKFDKSLSDVNVNE